MPELRGARDGIKVVDCTSYLAGPYGAMMLADMGASVVKVESLEAERAELVQTAGRVRYDVTPNARRKFVVRVREVRVSVLGTAFYLEVSPAAVAVKVEHGSVEVVQHDRRVVLASGETINADYVVLATGSTGAWHRCSCPGCRRDARPAEPGSRALVLP